MSSWRQATPRSKALGLSLLMAVLAGLTWTLPPIPQPLDYHRFADQRACLGLPNCLDTASNVLFVLAGVAGLRLLYRPSGRPLFIEQGEVLPYALFFFAAILVGLGSGFYHLAPDNERLVWDRAAMALALMAWLAAILCERVSVKAGIRLLLPLVAAGLFSVAWWHWSEARSLGDLRPYGLMQLSPMVLIPLVLRLYPPRYSHDRDILMVIGLYGAALLCDLSDRLVFTLTHGLVSGHTLKHMIAALAVWWVMRYLQRRKIL
jgi:hypothetical protein